MPQSVILIVEDDQNISKLVKYNLEKAGYQASIVVTGEDALSFLERSPVDLVILDIMLPKMDGLQTCRRIRADSKLAHIPVLFLSARGEEVDRVVGFELGADDYVVKPFSPRELVLRVKTLLKRRDVKEAVSRDLIHAQGNLVIDIPRHKVMLGQKEIVLTPMEFKLLVILIERCGRVQSREQLLQDVWNIEADVTTRTVDTHIKRLRQKLSKSGDLIETVRGLGYRFNDTLSDD